MEKYQRKETILVLKYKPGMEDGFTCLPFVRMCEWKDEDGLYKQCHKCKLNIKKIPYIDGKYGKEFIYKDSILVKYHNYDTFRVESRKILLKYENITRKEKLKKINEK